MMFMEAIMKTTSNRFLGMPQTKLGWWGVGLSALFTVLFVLAVNELLRFPGFLIMTIGVVGGVLTLISVIWKRERSWLIWLLLLPGLFAILFALGEILYPH